MLCPFKFFSTPALIDAARKMLLEWCKSGDRVVYLFDPEQLPQAGFPTRQIEQAELDLLDLFIELDWLDIDYGGFVTGDSMADVRGYGHFSMVESRQRASLTGLVLQPDPAVEILYQHPAFDEILKALLKEAAHLEKLFLPFEVEVEDFAYFQEEYKLIQAEEPGWWWRTYRPGLENKNLEGKSFLEMEVQLPVAGAEVAQKMLSHYGYNSLTYTDSVKAGDIPLEPRLASIKTFAISGENDLTYIKRIDGVLRRLSRNGPNGFLQVRDFSGEEMDHSRRELFPIVRAGKRFVVKAYERPYEPEPDELLIQLGSTDQVFGLFHNGLHSSTQLLLEVLENFIDAKIHHRLLDMGTGSGILAIASALLGVESILALDAYRLAVQAARENALANAVGHQIQVELGSLDAVDYSGDRGLYAFSQDSLQPPDAIQEMTPFDVIISNTFPRALLPLAPKFAENIRPGGLLISSGYFKEQGDEINAAFEKQGFIKVQGYFLSNWMAMIHVKK